MPHKNHENETENGGITSKLSTVHSPICGGSTNQFVAAKSTKYHGDKPDWGNRATIKRLHSGRTW
jgi:hypothetical protein